MPTPTRSFTDGPRGRRGRAAGRVLPDARLRSQRPRGRDAGARRGAGAGRRRRARRGGRPRVRRPGRGVARAVVQRRGQGPRAVRRRGGWTASTRDCAEVARTGSTYTVSQLPRRQRGARGARTPDGAVPRDVRPAAHPDDAGPGVPGRPGRARTAGRRSCGPAGRRTRTRSTSPSSRRCPCRAGSPRRACRSACRSSARGTPTRWCCGPAGPTSGPPAGAPVGHPCWGRAADLSGAARPPGPAARGTAPGRRTPRARRPSGRPRRCRTSRSGRTGTGP